MNNFNHANDKLQAPHCDFINNGNQFSNQMHYLKSLLQSLETAYEGFYRAKNYSNADIEMHLRVDGEYQKRFYIQLFDETLLALGILLDDMQVGCEVNMEGK